MKMSGEINVGQTNGKTVELTMFTLHECYLVSRFV